MTQTMQGRTILAVQEPGYTNVWFVQTAAGVTVARMTVGPEAEAWAKRIAEALNDFANRKPVNAVVKKIEQSALPSELNEYKRLFTWRAAWQALANKFELNRLQSRQERIERRAVICNNKIHVLMRAFDARTGNTCNPV